MFFFYPIYSGVAILLYLVWFQSLCAKVLLVATAVVHPLARANVKKRASPWVSTLAWQTLFYSFGGTSPQVITYEKLLLKWAKGVMHPGFESWIGCWSLPSFHRRSAANGESCRGSSKKNRKTPKRLDLYGFMILDVTLLLFASFVAAQISKKFTHSQAWVLDMSGQYEKEQFRDE